MGHIGVPRRTTEVALLLAALYLSAACSSHEGTQRYSGGSLAVVAPNVPDTESVEAKGVSTLGTASSTNGGHGNIENTRPDEQSSGDDLIALLHDSLTACNRSGANKSECARLALSLAKLQRLCEENDVLRSLCLGERLSFNRPLSAEGAQRIAEAFRDRLESRLALSEVAVTAQRRTEGGGSGGRHTFLTSRPGRSALTGRSATAANMKAQEIQETIDGYVRSLDSGFLAYQIPTSIERGNTLHAYLIVDNDKAKLVIPQVDKDQKPGSVTTDVKPTKVGPYLAATLTLVQGEGLVIQSTRDESQARISDQPFQWDWAVKAEKRGHDRLRMTLFIEVPKTRDEKEHRLRYKEFEQSVDVNVSGIASVEDAVSAVWTWAFGGIAEAFRTALGAAVLAIFVAWWRKRRTDKHRPAWVPSWKWARVGDR